MTRIEWQDGPALALEWVGNFHCYLFYSFRPKKDDCYLSQIPKTFI